MTTRDSHVTDDNYTKIPPKSTLMRFEEIAVLNRIIFPYQIEGNNLTQYQAFEKVKQELNASHFRSPLARSIWQQLERLYAAHMPFCQEFFEFGCLGDLFTTSGVLDITPQIKLLKGAKYGL